jgi:ribosomal-protein-alanine N-acetyltransferase
MTSRVLARGDRVYLRRLTASDAEEFIERTRASRRLHDRWAAPPDTVDAFRDYLARSRRRDAETLLVCRAEDGAIAGVFTLSQIFQGSFQNAVLGYFAFEPFARKAYMREGLGLVLRRAFDEIGLHRVEASIQPGNRASIALVQGAGFRLEGYSPRYLKIAGRWRDHERWAITAEDRAGPRRAGRLDRGPRRRAT